MIATIRILPSQADDLAAVCGMGVDALDRVADAISDAPVTIKRERLRELVTQSLPAAEAEVLCRVIFGLSSIESHKAARTDETVDGITATLKARFASDSRFLDWDVVAPSLLKILKCRSVYFAAKAIDIAYDFERILTDCRIITSIRPVYTDARDAIVGSTIVQTLRLDYVDSNGHSDSISLAVDLSDVARLHDIAREAKDKAEVASKKLESWKLETLLAGDGKQ
jgi:hypothetical protein